MDPYGYPDSAPGSVNSSAPTLALWTGVGAALSAAMGPCTCYVTYLVSLPLALAAIWYGWQGYQSNGNLERNVSAAALISGLVSLVPSLIILMVMIMYLGIFGFALVGAALDH